MSVAYIGIGSNQGDRQKNIESSLEKLRSRNGIELKAVSTMIETEPVGDAAQDKFLNGVCCVDTTLYPDELLGVLKSIEKELGRYKDSSPRRLSAEEQLRLFEQGMLDHPSSGQDSIQPQADIAQENAWQSRPIDLDILFYDDVIIKGISLTIPHPLLHQRMFVLKPLSEIAPDLVHPVLKRSIREIIEDIQEPKQENTVAEEHQADGQRIE